MRCPVNIIKNDLEYCNYEIGSYEIQVDALEQLQEVVAVFRATLKKFGKIMAGIEVNPYLVSKLISLVFDDPEGTGLEEEDDPLETYSLFLHVYRTKCYVEIESKYVVLDSEITI